jgi:hypothetical protein
MHFEGALLHDDEFFLRVPMREVRGLSWIEGGDVALEDGERRGRIVSDVTPLAVGGRSGLQIVPFEDGRSDLRLRLLLLRIVLGHDTEDRKRCGDSKSENHRGEAQVHKGMIG